MKTTVPKHLKGSSRSMWQRLRADYYLDDAAAIALLLAACEAHQRAEQARVAIAQAGACLPDRFGQLKASPWCSVERDSRSAMIAALRALKLAPGGDTP